MDTTDPNILFDENGVCDYCHNYDNNINTLRLSKQDKEIQLEKMAAKIKKAGKNGDYDCIVGLSGGADSSYCCYILKEVMHLNPLVVVVDTGWNLNVAVENIERIVKGLKLDMYTEVVNWNEIKDLQLSYFKAQVPYQDFPQDHAIFASLYNYAVKHNIKYVVSGSNSATEFVRPPLEWLYMNDLKMAKDVHKKFGKVPLKTFPTCGMLKYKIYYPIVKGMKRVYPLDLVEFDKAEAMKILNEKYGWEPYAHKHYENVFTRFFEGYYLPHKFGFDTRKNVFTSMILDGTITREEALNKLEEEPYSMKEMLHDKEYIAKKLGISTDEFDEIISGENKTFRDYKNSYRLITFGIKVMRMLGKEKRNMR
jgi:N-acetyl sugar amidotransferase